MNNDNHRIIKELLTAQEAGTPVVLATITKARGSVPRHVGTKMLVYENGRFTGTIGGGEVESRVIDEAQLALDDGHSRTIPYAFVDPAKGDPGVCGGEIELYLEPFLPPATLFVIGCGHVGQALADLGHWLGFRVIVTDDREELAAPEHIPHADVYLPGSIEDALTAQTITRSTFITLVTRNVTLDRQILPLLARTPAPYIGVMGSRRRWAETKKLLLADGISEADLARFHSPLGLELSAETPKEIAVSILAEIIMLYRGGTGERMMEEGRKQKVES
ncbi:MAG: XdhC family protein [Ardenticatenaceae bacterium]|nr:XdhC family protein [Ardenticatenaceae bacterium]MCB9443110.1 XdhC family protein [Ardenticatenaceae bacterium]